jgi:outer membrane immunogenic protein
MDSDFFPSWGLGMNSVAIVGAGLLSIAGFVGAASGADLPTRTYTKVPAIVAPVYDWNGFYLGLNGGGASSRECYTITTNNGIALSPTPSEGCHDGRQPIGCSASKPRAIGPT